MKNTKTTIGQITKEDSLKALRIANREIELENSIGWVCVHKVHKTEKNYSRKSKHNKSFLLEN